MTDVVGDLSLTVASGWILWLSQNMTAGALTELGYEPKVSGSSAFSRGTNAVARLAMTIVALIVVGSSQFAEVYLALGFRPDYPLSRLASIVEVAVFIGWLVVVLRRVRSSGRPRLRG